MSDNCDITGLSPEDANLFSHLHSQLVGTLKLNEPSNDTLTGFEKPLQRTVSNHRFTTGDIKRKESLIKHLEKSITSKFNGSKLTAFGSSESGLSLKTGDLDLCLQASNADQKKMIKRISGMLRGQGMESVQALTRAKVPIVKFTDPRSGMNVDISINNTLAIHNTKLLSDYSKLDERVRQVAICVKHWALHRNLCDAPNGTLSSYAWSILVIFHLIKEGVIVNLQAGEDRTVAEIEGKEYDITINDVPKYQSSSKATLAELLHSFFKNFATWNWAEDIISLREGKALTRDEKGWMNEEPSALDVINSQKEKPPRMGEHHLSIEDPFDLDHDLSRVVRALGELKIRDELIRATKIFGDGGTWNSICETVDAERLKDMEPADIFHDLRDKNDDLVKSMLEKTNAEMSALEKRIEAVDAERKSNIRMAKAMRGVIEETSDLRKEHKSIVINLKERNKKIDEIKKLRDKINADIILPIHMIEDELAKVYSRLTKEIDIHQVPSLQREKEHFSWFLELQSMHGKAREASELHQRFIELVTEQKSEIKKLKIFETKHDETTTKLLEQEPLLKDKNINSSEARSYDRRTYSIQKALRQLRGDIHKLRREAGRLEAWLRKKSSSQSRGRRDGRKNSHRKQKSSTPKQDSGPMTLGDISGLLSEMSNETTSKKTKKVSSKKAGMRKLGNLGAHRGSRGQYKKKD